MQPSPSAIEARPELQGAAEPRGRSSASASLYRVIWRWHFYAGLLVTPVLLVVATTGALSIFRQEIEDAAGARLRFVEPGSTRKGAQDLVDLAGASHPGLRPVALELPGEANRAAVVRLGALRGERSVAVYLDPYRGRVLGSIGPGSAGGLAGFFEVVLEIHRSLFLGMAGRLVVELVVGWTVLLLATGLYLWWPEPKSGARGVWVPRWRGAKPYVVLRDLHTVGGFYLLAPIALIVATGLFYSPVWSEAFHLATGRGRQAAPATAAKPVGEAKVGGGPEATRPALPLDRIVALAGDRYPGRNLFVTLPEGSARSVKVGAANDYNNSYGPYVSAEFELDRADGRLLSHKTLAEDPRYWWHGWVYPLHVGSVLGPASKALWLVACLVLIGLPITGVWMWWARRPSGRTGFPKRPAKRLPPALIAGIVGFSVFLPVVGASIVLILAGEWAARLGLDARARARLDLS